MNLWAGRFQKELDRSVNDFNSSIRFDCRMVEQDIQGSIAHATMLAETGIISPQDADQIVTELQQIRQDLADGSLVFDPEAEDIHLFLEQLLTQRIGTPGKRLHTARSRNDQVALDLRLWLRDQSAELTGLLRHFIATICDIAEQHTTTIMPGYTHLQRAQPVTFGHHLMAYAWMFARDLARLQDAARRMNQNPLGSGALAGTTYPINRTITTQLLGFDGASENSLDGVSDRDFCLEIAAALSIIMVHLSRLSEEIILWCSFEFRFIELDDAFATGSSIMPQKKNPDIAELVRGKSGRVFGDLMALLTVMKGLPLAYNKDMQEDKEAIFDAVDTVKLCVSTITPMLSSMRVNVNTMRQAAAGGFINATDCADYLVKKGMPFREAYTLTGELVAQCIAERKTLETLELSAYQEKSNLFDEDLYDAISLETCLNKRTSFGGPSPSSVQRQIDQMRESVLQAEPHRSSGSNKT